MRTALATAGTGSLCAAALAALAALSVWHPLVGLGVAVYLVGLVILSARPQWVGPLAYLCAGLMFCDLSPVSPGATVRLYQPLTLLLIATPAARCVGRMQVSPLRRWLVLFTAAVVASFAWTISASDTVVVAVGQVYLLYVFLIYGTLLHRKIVTPRGLLTSVWAGATLCSLAVVLQFFAAYVGSTWQIFDVVGVPWHRPAGLMSEPDWAGLVAGMGSLLGYFRPARSKWRRLSLLLCSFAVVVTAVRAVWVALVLVLVIGTVTSRPVRRMATTLAPFLVLIGAAAVFVMSYQTAALSRFSPSAVMSRVGDQGAFQSRLGVLQLVLDHGPDRFWTGHGAGTLGYETNLESIRLQYGGGGVLNAGHGSTNLFGTDYWDLGLLGLVITAGLVLSWLLAAKRASAYPALLPVALLLVVDFQNNNGIRLGFVWVVLAVTSYCAARSVTDRAGSGGKSTEPVPPGCTESVHSSPEPSEAAPLLGGAVSR